MKILTSILLAVLGIVMALAVVELGFRVIHLDANHGDGWNDRPKFYYSAENAPTLQDRLHQKKKDPNAFRIAVIGDSFTFAPYLQFDDTFPKRLERMLNLNVGQRTVEVINYGVPRYSTSHEVGVVSKALKEHADLILLQVTLNDPEIKPYQPTGLLGGTVNRWGQLELKDGVYSYWHSLAYFMTRLYNRETRRNYIDYFFGLFNDEPSYSSFKNSMAQISKMCAKRKVPIAAVVFPLFGLPLDKDYPFTPLHKKVAAVLDRFGIKNLDLFEAYRGIPIERLKVIPTLDFHPNEIAHRIAAEQIYQWLADLALLPADALIKARFDSRIDIRRPDMTADPLAK